MDMFCIEGGVPLNGTVRVGGSKNASLPILAASLAIQGEVIVRQVPQLQDIVTMSQLLQSMGAIVETREDGSISVDPSQVKSSVAP